MKVVAFVPIKMNSQRLPGKNTKFLNGKPLCAYIFETILKVNGIDERYVYCSDPKIYEYIPDGINFLRRDTYLDGNEVKGLEIIDRFIKDVDADIYVLAHATQPFTKATSISDALSKVISQEHDSAFSALEFQDYFWMNGTPLNYNLKDVVRTQDLEKIYMETGAFFIFRKEVYTNLGQRVGKNPYIKSVDHFEAIDIDYPEDFEFAEAIAKYLESL